MHKLIDFVCEELEELERKADKDGKLSMQEVQYADTLAHMKKNLLKSEEMMEESGYSMDGSYDGRSSYNGDSYRRGGGRSSRRSYARGGRRSSRRAYSMDGYSSDDMMEELRELMQSAPDDRTRKEFERFIQKIETM